jgi:hypothetical protein
MKAKLTAIFVLLALLALLTAARWWWAETKERESTERQHAAEAAVCLREIQEMVPQVATVEILGFKGELIRKVKPSELGRWVEFLEGLSPAASPSLKVALTGFVRFTSTEGTRLELSIYTDDLVTCRDGVWLLSKEEAFDPGGGFNRE